MVLGGSRHRLYHTARPRIHIVIALVFPPDFDHTVRTVRDSGPTYPVSSQGCAIVSRNSNAD